MINITKKKHKSIFIELDEAIEQFLKKNNHISKIRLNKSAYFDLIKKYDDLDIIEQNIVLYDGYEVIKNKYQLIRIRLIG